MVVLGLTIMAFGFILGFILDFIAGKDIYSRRIPKWAFGCCTIAIFLGSALIVLGLLGALIVSLG